MSLKEEKQQMRAMMRRLRKEWERDGSPDEASVRIGSSIEALPAFKSARTVLLYASLPGEVPTDRWLSRWHADKRLVLPRVAGDRLELREYRTGCISEGYLGIMEPSAEAPEVEPSEIDLAIIPGVAFDASGRRLGHGGGFYDRLIPQLDCLKVGVALPYRIVAAVPSEEHDGAVDICISLDSELSL